MKNLFSLENRKVLITGSAQGIGFLLAKGLAEFGAEIIVNDITAERAEKAAAELRDSGFVAYAAAFNVTDHDAVNDAIAQIENNIGAIDILINNA
ncbi:SDR family NAD(P)-dependent oxidoreductase, partial [Yersinia enterocolitica]